MDIGKKGELIAMSWALDVDITPNPVENDKTGWDLIYEFPERFDLDGLTADLIPKPIQCWVQVKTTQQEDPKWQIKLTNLKRLVDTPLPAFYLELKLDQDYGVEAAYIFHVGKEIIYNTYKKLRELGPEGKESAHKKKIQLPKGSKTKISPVGGSGLKNEIEKIIGENYQDYLDKKKDIKEKCGYEDDRNTVSFNFEVPKEYDGNIEEYLVDFELGIVSKMEIKDFVEKDIRFGIPIEVNREKEGELKVSSQDEKDVTLIIRTKDHREKISLDSRLIFPSATRAVISKENIKFLVRSPNIEMIVAPFKNKITYNYSFPGYEQEVTLDNLRDISNFIWFFHKMKDVEDGLILTISYREKKRLEAKLEIEEELGQNIFIRALSVRYAIKIFNNFGIPLDTPLLLEELINQFDKIQILAKTIEPKHFEISWTYKVESLIEEELKGGKAACIYPYDLSFGSTNVWVIVAFRGILQIVGKNEEEYELELESSDITIEDYQVWEGNIEEPPRKITDSMATVKKKYQEDYLIISKE